MGINTLGVALAEFLDHVVSGSGSVTTVHTRPGRRPLDDIDVFSLNGYVGVTTRTGHVTISSAVRIEGGAQ